MPTRNQPAPKPSPVDAIRAQIDEVDQELLNLLERRQRLATEIGALKPPSPLKLNPAREAHVIDRLTRAAAPEVSGLVEPLWREVMSAGLSLQQEIEIAVWPSNRGDLGRLARGRFGGQAKYSGAATWEKALGAAAAGEAIAVLELNAENPWWAELLKHPELWIFDALGGRGPTDPVALAVGRMEPDTLARGVVYRVSLGGDSEPRGAPERLLQVDHGRRLTVSRDNGERELAREMGIVGAAGA